jgi:hypothetical protein
MFLKIPAQMSEAWMNLEPSVYLDEEGNYELLRPAEHPRIDIQDRYMGLLEL